MSRPRPTHDRAEAFEALCRERGLPLTVQRRVILQAMLERDDHPTADQIYDAVKTRIPGLSRTTVYRVLDTLVQFGVVGRVSHPGGVTRFDAKVHQHHHLVCLKCGVVIDVEDERLNRIALPPIRTGGFQVHAYDIHFRGVCAACTRRAAPKRPATGRSTTRTALGTKKRRK